MRRTSLWTVTAESVSAPGLPAKAGSHESPKKNRVASAFRRKLKRRSLLVIQLIRATSPTNRPDMVKINPSLMFTGACGDAFRRYASLFGGEIVMMLTYAESPLQQREPREWGDKVWFARPRRPARPAAAGPTRARRSWPRQPRG